LDQTDVLKEELLDALDLVKKKMNRNNSNNTIVAFSQNIAYFQIAIQMTYLKNYDFAWYNIGLIYQNLKILEIAIFCYEECLSLDTGVGLLKDSLKEICYVNLGICHFYLKDRGLAFKYLDKALELNPNSCDAWANLANCYLELGNKRKAETLAVQALRIKPEHPIAKNVYWRLTAKQT